MPECARSSALARPSNSARRARRSKLSYPRSDRLAGLDPDALVLGDRLRPIWAIGTGRTALPDDAGTIAGMIRETVTNKGAQTPPRAFGFSMGVR